MERRIAANRPGAARRHGGPMRGLNMATIATIVGDPDNAAALKCSRLRMAVAKLAAGRARHAGPVKNDEIRRFRIGNRLLDKVGNPRKLRIYALLHRFGI